MADVRRPLGPASATPDLPFLLRHPAHLIGLGFGAGLIPRVPGTFGTLVAFPLYWGLSGLPEAVYWGLVALAVPLGIWACERTGQALGAPDHDAIVWDEIVAFLIVLPLAPEGLLGALLAFASFRLFDVWKPFPIGWLDARVRGGLGVMLDDLLAAVYAIAVLRALGPEV